MLIGEFCNRNVVVVTEAQSVTEAARIMRQHRVGDVVVTRGTDLRQVPVGILTDRDVATEIVADKVDPDSVTVKDTMSFELVTVSETDDMLQTVEMMRQRKIRRVPVVDEEGVLVGILTVDDVLDVIAEMLTDIAKLVTAR